MTRLVLDQAGHFSVQGQAGLLLVGEVGEAFPADTNFFTSMRQGILQSSSSLFVSVQDRECSTVFCFCLDELR